MLRADPSSSLGTQGSGWGLRLPCGAAQGGGRTQPAAALLFGSRLVMSQEGQEAEESSEEQ